VISYWVPPTVKLGHVFPAEGEDAVAAVAVDVNEMTVVSADTAAIVSSTADN
jgi:hypothetical protein